MPEGDVRQLSNDDAGATLPDWAVVEALGVQVDSEIDAALRAGGGVDALPLASPPALVVGLSNRLLRCALNARRVKGDLGDAIKEDCRAARATLTDIANGNLDIGQPQQDAAPGSGWTTRVAPVASLDMTGY